MNTRQTSIDCYNEIKANGLLSKRRLQVYEILLENGCLTGTEIAILFKQKYFSSNHSEGIRNRVSELFERGVVYEKGIVKCKSTGRKVIQWDLTDKLPIKIKSSKKTKKQKINDAINSLRELYKNKNNNTSEDWKVVADLIKII
jgi:hypothetical protein|tara:strand:- start:1073 stop:1504 length:432 start_codon:yes stop_codon:yes gene_type:complete